MLDRLPQSVSRWFRLWPVLRQRPVELQELRRERLKLGLLRAEVSEAAPTSVPKDQGEEEAYEARDRPTTSRALSLFCSSGRRLCA